MDTCLFPKYTMFLMIDSVQLKTSLIFVICLRGVLNPVRHPQGSYFAKMFSYHHEKSSFVDI